MAPHTPVPLSKPTSRAQPPRSKPASRLPRNWPANLPYLTTPTYSRSLTTAHLHALHTPSSASTTAIAPPTLRSPHTRIQPIPPSSPHPARGQHGVFATSHLPPDTLIVPYTGHIHGPGADADPASDYDLSIGPREVGLGIDAAAGGCEARFVNDYRGVREAGPNAEFREMWVSVGGGGGGGGRVERWMGVFVLPVGKSGRGAKGIRRGEEVVVSYGKGFWRERSAVDGSGGAEVGGNAVVETEVDGGVHDGG